MHCRRAVLFDLESSEAGAAGEKTPFPSVYVSGWKQYLGQVITNAISGDAHLPPSSSTLGAYPRHPLRPDTVRLYN